MRGRLFHIEDDWYEWRQQPQLAAEVQVRIAPHDDGRLAIHELRVIGEPSSELLRAIPVGRIEAVANAQLTVVDQVAVPATVHRRRRARPPGARAQPAGIGWEQAGPGAARGGAGRGGRARGGTGDGGQRGRPDRFYADVAEAYSELAQRSRRPAADLAASHRVPVTTVHRWIKEARRRGYLGAGRPGKAG